MYSIDNRLALCKIYIITPCKYASSTFSPKLLIGLGLNFTQALAMIRQRKQRRLCLWNAISMAWI